MDTDSCICVGNYELMDIKAKWMISFDSVMTKTRFFTAFIRWLNAAKFVYKIDWQRICTISKLNNRVNRLISIRENKSTWTFHGSWMNEVFIKLIIFTSFLIPKNDSIDSIIFRRDPITDTSIRLLTKKDRIHKKYAFILHLHLKCFNFAI